MRVLFVLLVTFIVAAQGYKKKVAPDAYCDTTLTPVQSNEIELKVFNKLFKKINGTNVASLLKELNVISKFPVEIADQIMECITNLENRQAEIDAKLDPYLADPLTPNAQSAKDELATYVTNAITEYNSLKTALDTEYASIRASYEILTLTISASIASTATDALTDAQGRVTTPQIQACACEAFRSFVRFCLDIQSIFIGCTSNSIEIFTDTKNTLRTMIASTCRAVDARLKNMDKCFENVAVEQTDATKALLNSCLGAMADNLGDITTELTDLFPPIKNYQVKNFVWDFDLTLTCIAISQAELTTETNRYYNAFSTCVGGTSSSTFKIYDDFSDVKKFLQQYKSNVIISKLIARLPASI